jgi:serine/threonine-protein kinase PpkA
LQQIEKGLTLMPNHPELIKLRDEIHTQQVAEQKRQAEQVQRDQEVKTLLKQAETQWKAKHLTEPVGNNAEATYRQILKLDAGNSQAQAGLERIAQDYLQQARQRRDAGALPDSLALIDKGLAIIPNQAELTQLREDVSQGIAELKARQQRDKEQQVQVEQLLMQAQRSVQEGQWEISLAHIEQGLLVIPNHRELLALREQVKLKRAEQQRQAELRQKAEEAERQKAEQAEAAQKKAAEAERQKAEQAEAAQKKAAEAERQKAEQAEAAQKKTAEAERLKAEQAEAVQKKTAEAERLKAQQAAEQKQQAEQAKREQEINGLLEKAEVHFKAKRLTTPTGGNNAEATYRQVLKLDADNTQAQAGLARIAQDYLQQAKLRQSAGAFQESLGLIEKGLAVVPNQAELAQLQEDVRGQLAAEQQRQEQQRLERQQQEQQRKERQQVEQQQQDVKPQKDEQKKLEQQRQEQQRKEQQRLEQKRQEEQRQQDQQRQQEQQRKEQRQQEKQQQEQQKKLEQQQQLEQQRKEQQRLDQQRQQDQQRKLEQQRQTQQPKEQKPEPAPETTKPRVFGTF